MVEESILVLILIKVHPSLGLMVKLLISLSYLMSIWEVKILQITANKTLLLIRKILLAQHLMQQEYGAQ